MQFLKTHKVKVAAAAIVLLALATVLSLGSSSDYSRQGYGPESQQMAGSNFLSSFAPRVAGMGSSYDSDEMAYAEDQEMAYAQKGIDAYPMPPIIETEGESVYENETERRLVKNGSISMVVTDIDQARSNIENVVATTNGFVSNSNFNQYKQYNRYGEEAGSSSRSGNITVKIPQDSFVSFMTNMRDLALVVTNENSYVNDVTERYTDLETRLANKKAEEKQYRTLLAQARTISDTLEVTRYVNQARTDVERLQGQLNVLSNQTNLSVVNIYLESEKPVEVFGVTWDPMGQVKYAANQLISGLVQLADKAISFVVLLPLLALYVLVYGAIALIVWKVGRWGYTKYFVK